jgi:hypothetical protein
MLYVTIACVVCGNGAVQVEPGVGLAAAQFDAATRRVKLESGPNSLITWLRQTSFPQSYSRFQRKRCVRVRSATSLVMPLRSVICIVGCFRALLTFAESVRRVCIWTVVVGLDNVCGESGNIRLLRSVCESTAGHRSRPPSGDHCLPRDVCYIANRTGLAALHCTCLHNYWCRHEQIIRLRGILQRGVGVHHGGLLPIMKEVRGTA